MKRPLIIGQAPARGNDEVPPFSGDSGARLAQLAGVGDSGDALPYHFHLINILDKWPGKQGPKGDAFDIRIASIAARDKVYPWIEAHRDEISYILMMGRKVRRAMGMNSSIAYFQTFQLLGLRAMVFPHPSGVNRWWNDPVNEQEAGIILRAVLNG